MKNVVILVILLSTSFFVFIAARSNITYKVIDDVRLPKAFRDDMKQIGAINKCETTSKQDAANKLWNCLLRDESSLNETLIDPQTRAFYSKDVGPIPLLLALKNNMCLNSTKTIQCFDNYLRDLSKNCLNESAINSDKLIPLKTIVAKVCNGTAIDDKMQNVLQCLENYHSKYISCLGSVTGAQLHDLKSTLGVIPYFYEYSCRQIYINEICVRVVVQHCRLIEENTFVGELFDEIRNTPICSDSNNIIPRNSLKERTYQNIDIRRCKYGPAIGARFHSFSLCRNLNIPEILKELEKYPDAASLEVPVQKYCQLLPEVDKCFDIMAGNMTTCILSDYKYFGKHGFIPLFRSLEYVCNGHTSIVHDLLDKKNNECLFSQMFNAKGCLDRFKKNYAEKMPYPQYGFLYADSELLDDFKTLQFCLGKEVRGCDANYIYTIYAVIQLIINELTKNVITYESPATDDYVIMSVNDFNKN